MEIQKCRMCDKPIFKAVSATSDAKRFDPDACRKCNKEAIENSN